MLPRVPSKLIRVALADLRTCEALPEKYHMCMDVWYSPTQGGKCMLCLAGAVIAQSLGNGEHTRYPNDFPDDSDQLYALNAFRLGSMHAGFTALGIYNASGVMDNVNMPTYGEPGFHDALEAMADHLELKGY